MMIRWRCRSDNFAGSTDDLIATPSGDHDTFYVFAYDWRPDSMEAEGNDSPHTTKQQPFHAVFDCEVHGDLPLNTRVQNNLLTLLLGNSY